MRSLKILQHFRNKGLRQKKSFVRKKQLWFYFLELVYIQSQYILNFNFLLCSLPEMYASPLTEHKDLDFIIHPCDPTVVVCYLIRPCDIAVCITYLISHSYSLTYNLRIFQFGCIINTKPPECVDIIRRTS